MPVSCLHLRALKTVTQCYPNSSDTVLGAAGMTTNTGEYIQIWF